MKKYYLIISFIAILIIAGYFILFNGSSIPKEENKQLVEVAGAQGCCMNPSCEECFVAKGFCDCQEREKKGKEACDECEEAESCGIEADVCAVDLE